MGVFATFLDDTTLGSDIFILGTSPMKNEERFSVFDRTIENVVSLIGDNSITNRSFCRRVVPILVGYHIHRYSLAVKYILREHKKRLKD